MNMQYALTRVNIYTLTSNVVHSILLYFTL